MTVLVKGHESFVEFLDKELPEIGLTHAYDGSTGYRNYYVSHVIRRVKYVESHLLFFHWLEEEITLVASIEAEPDSILEGGDSSKLAIKVFDKEALPAITELCNKFEVEFSPLKAEIVYRS